MAATLTACCCCRLCQRCTPQWSGSSRRLQRLPAAAPAAQGRKLELVQPMAELRCAQKSPLWHSGCEAAALLSQSAVKMWCSHRYSYCFDAQQLMCCGSCRAQLHPLRMPPAQAVRLWMTAASTRSNSPTVIVQARGRMCSAAHCPVADLQVVVSGHQDTHQVLHHLLRHV